MVIIIWPHFGLWLGLGFWVRVRRLSAADICLRQNLRQSAADVCLPQSLPNSGRLCQVCDRQVCGRQTWPNLAESEANIVCRRPCQILAESGRVCQVCDREVCGGAFGRQLSLRQSSALFIFYKSLPKSAIFLTCLAESAKKNFGRVCQKFGRLG